MSAKQNGKSYFQINTGGDQERLDLLIDKTMSKVLATLQTAIVLLTNESRDKELEALQSCVSELLRQASECRREGKKMAIIDEYQGTETLQ